MTLATLPVTPLPEVTVERAANKGEEPEFDSSPCYDSLPAVSGCCCPACAERRPLRPAPCRILHGCGAPIVHTPSRNTSSRLRDFIKVSL